MDQFTQMTLGAAIGQATLHRDLGNKAALWGVLGGLLPDLDMLAFPLMDTVSKLSWHRGISHSLLLILVLAPLLGWLIHRMHRRAVTVERAAWFVFLVLGTHVLLDCFTTYGTGVFEQFSDYRVSFNNLLIIDPLFTVPLLIGVIASLFPGETRAKLFRNAAGIIIGSAYVAVTLALKFGTMPAFTRALDGQSIAYTRITTTPTPFNSLLWRAVAEDAGGYWIGYYSVFDNTRDVKFWRVTRNEQLLAGLEDDRAVRELRWFSDGWYTVSRDERGLVFHDLRFGEYDSAIPANNFGMGHPRTLEYPFSFRLLEMPPGSADRSNAQFLDFKVKEIGTMMEVLWERIRGV